MLGGIHGTLMFRQVLSEAPWIDVIVHGDGEEIMPPPVASTVKDLDGIDPDWPILDWSQFLYTPLGVRVAIPNMARGCPFACSFCSQRKFRPGVRVRETACRDCGDPACRFELTRA